MPSEREKRLLWMLGTVAAFSAFALAIGLGAERMAAARATTSKYEAEVAKLSRALPSEAEAVSLRDRLKAELGQGKSRFYAPGEMSPYSFGTLVRKKLAARGISVIRYQVVEDNPVPADAAVLADQAIRLSTAYSRRHYPENLRLVHYRDPDGKDYVFLTNRPDLPALAVADLYRQLWQIETFFRWIKQNLKIKAFYGTSENAV